MKVEKWNPERDGPFSEPALRKKLESRGCRVSRYVYPPGTFFADHTHSVDKIDAVVSGEFRMTTGEGSVILTTGDLLAVPRGTVHSAQGRRKRAGGESRCHKKLKKGFLDR